MYRRVLNVATNMSQNKYIRETLFEKRKLLSTKEVQSCSKVITEKLLLLPEFQNSKHIGLYWPILNEVDTHAIVYACWKLNKLCYLPRIKPKFQMDFCPFTAETVLAKNHMGLTEPCHTAIVDTKQLDLVIVPLVGFDAKGHRLGFGSGYYDRHFEFKRKNTAQKPLLIGLGYSFQELSDINVDAWDVNLNIVITEKRVFY